MKRKAHIVLVCPLQAIHVTAGEHLGIGYLAAGLRHRGYSVEIIDGWLEQLSAREIASRIAAHEAPLCIGFSAYAPNLQSIGEATAALRAQGIECPFVGGGYGPTFQTEEFLNAGLDFVVRGEGDIVFPQLCAYIQHGAPPISELPSVSYIDQVGRVCHNSVDTKSVDLDALPFPARDTVQFLIRRRNPINILSSKGCMGHCTFCSIDTFERVAHGPRWRQRSIRGFVDELEELVVMYGVSHVKVVDDSLIEPPRDGCWCGRLADEIGKRNLKVRLRGSIRADRVTNEVLVELRRAGFIFFSCGIENFAGTALDRIGKGATPEDNVRALELFREHGLYVESGYILFDDRTTLHELRQNHEMMQRYSWAVGKVFTQMYAAQETPFTRRLRSLGQIGHEPHLLGNYQYPILDAEARSVYHALRSWSKAHARLYDMATDPLKAFRVMDDDSFGMFHGLYVELHEHELDVFGSILEWVSEGMPAERMREEVLRQCEATWGWYERFECRLKDAYRLSGLRYEADCNPYV